MLGRHRALHFGGVLLLACSQVAAGSRHNYSQADLDLVGEAREKKRKESGRRGIMGGAVRSREPAEGGRGPVVRRGELRGAAGELRLARMKIGNEWIWGMTHGRVRKG